ncbi:MAG: ABC transporter substrate-binding protein [Chromatiales bacterium]|nr:ABC transporter substrate-binding protein [Chromatiales bacterium]
MHATRILSLMLLGMTLATGARAGEDTPIAQIEALQQGLLQVDREHRGASDAERFQLLEVLIRKTHDLPHMARLTLARRWANLNEAQQGEFIDLFSQLSIATYAERFRDLDGERFELRGERELRGDRREVRASLVSPGGSSVDFIYILHQHESKGWQIINVLADGVSELSLQRADYQRILARGSFDDLASFLRSRSDLVN